MSAVRRSLAGLLFGISFACACVAISGFLLERTAFSPADTADTAGVVLQDQAIQEELVRVISQSTANQMYPGDPAAADVIIQNITIVASTGPGAALLAGVVHDAHAMLIGDTDEPVQISPVQLVQVTRDERAAALPALTIDVAQVGALALANDVLDWLVPISALVAVVFFVLCLVARPERPALIRTLGLGMLVLAAAIVIFAYVVPRFLPTLLSDSPWANIAPRLADDALPLILGTALLLTGGGLALFVSSNRMGRSTRWSTPVSTYRYREDRRWS